MAHVPVEEDELDPEEDELDHVDSSGEEVRKYSVLRQRVTETVYLTVLHTIASRLNPAYAAPAWRWSKDFIEECVGMAKIQADNNLGDAEGRQYGSVLGVFAKDTARSAARRFLRESSIVTWWRDPPSDGRTREVLEAKAGEIAEATTLHMFLMMLNPKYRGLGFAWSQFVPSVQKWTKIYVEADLSEEEQRACGPAVLAHGLKVAKGFAAKLMKESDIVLWWDDAAQREQAKKGGESA